ncbi:TPR domain protein [Streptomyces himastatinicus ATCC 53653]|uniref:TPR domain protein n=1 Tax=Streptomyces himastatinicus ATCC 53653 TaxID=457427 RepID=D9W6I3_9ACTN|nr:TPR domain protein [Streptomyces himastatinicus ATCC 53653]
MLTGPGGQGKTRLARRLTDTLGWRGWVTGHLRSDLTDDPAPPDFTTLTTSLPLLLVVDYAETRPRLLRRLITHLHRSRHRVRVLLLARSDGQWRTGSLQAVPAVRDLLEEASVVPLAPLIPTSRSTRDRRHAFHRASQDLARLLPLLPTLPAHDWESLAAALRPPADLHDHRYDNVLTLQMTALVGLLQHGPRPVDAAPGTPPEGTLLKHEDRFWEASAKSPAYRLDLPAPTLGAAVAVAALCGAATKDEALHVITPLPGLPAHQTAPAANWLASLYPADGDRYWGSLQPDRVAEYHASRTLAEGNILLSALFDAAAPGQQAQLITVLARAAIAHYNVGRTTDSEQILHTMDTALDTTSLAYQAVLMATEALPYPSRITAPLALRLIGILARTNRQLVQDNPAAYEPDLAVSLSNLGVQLSIAGRGDEALTITEDAVEIYRRLAAGNPAAYETNLAASLVNLGVRLSEAGRRGEALTITEDAVEIYRRLAAGNQAAYELDLADSLSNLGVQLSKAGRRGQALTITEDAVEIYRRFAAGNPAAYETNLAASLVNLGGRLSEAGRRVEALTTMEDAVEIYRRLAAGNPAAYESDLAVSLSNLGVQLSIAGRGDEALTITEDAVEVRRRLAAGNPAAYEPDLAASLVNLGGRLSEAGRNGEGLTTMEDAVEIYRRLAAGNPAAYETNLARSLSNLGVQLSMAGRGDEALTITEDAVEIYRRLAVGDQAAYEPDLAVSLVNLGVQLSMAGRRGEALTITEDAVEIYRRLAAGNQAAYEPDLARSLSALALLLAARGELPRALRATEEAVELYRRHVETLPSYSPRFHTMLDLQADLLERLGREKEAEAVRRWLRKDLLPPDSHN